MRVDAPCKDCKKRFVGCHSKCLSYIDWKQERDVERTGFREWKNQRYTPYRKSHR